MDFVCLECALLVFHTGLMCCDKTGKRSSQACHETELITAKRLANWLCVAAKCTLRPEATSGPQKTSLALSLIYLHHLSPSHPPQLTLTSSFNDYLNCSFSPPPLLSLFQAKPIYGGWLCLAPEGTDFDNPMQRSRVRACTIGLACLFSK